MKKTLTAFVATLITIQFSANTFAAPADSADKEQLRQYLEAQEAELNESVAQNHALQQALKKASVEEKIGFVVFEVGVGTTVAGSLLRSGFNSPDVWKTKILGFVIAATAIVTTVAGTKILLSAQECERLEQQIDLKDLEVSMKLAAIFKMKEQLGIAQK